MSPAQIVICSLAVISIIAIALFYKKLPAKIAKSITSSLILTFSNILFINFLRPQIGWLATDTAIFIVIGALIALTTTVSFLIVFLVKDEEKQRKIFFSIAIFIFFASYLRYFISLVNWQGAFPAHLCRQISYTFPIIFFLKDSKFKRIVLPFYVYASIIGAFATLFPPGNILHNNWLMTWGDLDTVLTHFVMFVVPIIIIATKEVKPNLHHIWQFCVGLVATGLFALFNNYMEFLRTDKWGNGMYLAEPPIEFLPTWAFALICIAIVSIIIMSFNVSQIKGFFQKKPKQNDKIEK